MSQLKNRILKDGVLQFTMTTFLITSAGYLLGYSLLLSFVVACSLSLSSTAFVLSYLKESKQITLSYGQSSFGILLFQDIIAIPLLAMMPMFSHLNQGSLYSFFSLSKIMIASTTLVAVISFGHYALKPFVSFIHRQTNHEVFTATCLIVVLGTSLLFHSIGLSYALGAFCSGLFLADSEFKQEVEQVILPFKGILMGTFFMSFGLQFDLSFSWNHLSSLALITISLFALKSVILGGIGLIRFKETGKALKLSLIMNQGGEFGIVLLTAALSYGIIDEQAARYFTSTILLSLFLAPLMAKSSQFFHKKEVLSPEDEKEGELHSIEPLTATQEKAA